ncbi:integrase catalytic subunit [Anopheles sinensis]|uniref:Integrase catalytic subunit n=1 Tax=Anopheles sinensis TaxID=74873 RepID=A0A084WQ01_ANOSI|nr:integrase catalytic subunit [Anopheles sinensis]
MSTGHSPGTSVTPSKTIIIFPLISERAKLRPTATGFFLSLECRVLASQARYFKHTSASETGRAKGSTLFEDENMALEKLSRKRRGYENRIPAFVASDRDEAGNKKNKDKQLENLVPAKVEKGTRAGGA